MSRICCIRQWAHDHSKTPEQIEAVNREFEIAEANLQLNDHDQTMWVDPFEIAQAYQKRCIKILTTSTHAE